MSNLSYCIKMAEEQGAIHDNQRALNWKEQRQKEQIVIRERELKREKEKQKKAYEEFLAQENYFVDVLIKHRDLCDLHCLNSHEAKTLVGRLARTVAKSESMKCIGFIHGKGYHSGDKLSFYEIMLMSESELDEETKPVLIYKVRDLLNTLAIKLNCITIYGESMFEVVFENLRMKLRYGDFAEQNFGITYFMNKAYYDFFKKSDIEWTVDLVKRFQNQISTL